MMYTNKLSACIKVNGKVLRESKDKVHIPYGSEYTISIKNLNSVRASVTVEVDGTDATGNHELVIGPNQTVEFKRFITNGNLHEGNAFKFIERTAGIENHRGIKQDDGIIRIKFQFEQLMPKFNLKDYHKINVCKSPDYYGLIGHAYNNQNVLRSMTNNSGINQLSAASYTTSSFSDSSDSSDSAVAYSAAIPQHEVGITVPGQVTKQEFNVVSGFSKESEEHVIVLHLLGETDQGVQIKTPVTVKTKIECKFCGKSNKSSNKCCTECGASLVIV